MKLLLSLLALTSTASAYWKGFNLGANNPDGSCKSTADWAKDFTVMRNLPGSFTSARLYATSDCNTLANAVPAAISTGTSLLVGVWTEDDAHFGREKAALLAAIQQYGTDWIIAVTVGSEDLYRAETSGDKLSQQIYDVRGMLGTVSGSRKIEVGHVDTWTAWVDGRYENVITACDFIGTDGYPYFQDAGIDGSANVFWDSVNAVRNVVNRVHPGAWVWITETGWPVSGPTMGAAVPSQQNAQTYWKNVACSAFQGGHVFWYQLRDYNASPSFGVVDANWNPIIDLRC